MFVDKKGVGSLESNRVILFSAGAENASTIIDKLGAVGISTTHVRSREEAEREVVASQNAIIVYRCDRLSDDALTIVRTMSAGSRRMKTIVTVQTGCVDDAV